MGSKGEHRSRTSSDWAGFHGSGRIERQGCRQYEHAASSRVRQGVATCLLWWACTADVAAAAAPHFVEAGKALACIVVPDNPRPREVHAGSMLADYITKSTGVTLPLGNESTEWPENIEHRIHVGATDIAEQVAGELQDLDDDGYVLYPINDHTLIIVGPTDQGTEYGVYEFLERFVGVRWLMPGENGTHVPAKDRIRGPEAPIRDQPASFSRYFGIWKNDTQRDWLRHNRINNRIQFHHHLLKLLPPETYANTHPEFYPIRDGERFLPTSNTQHGWQPCFSAPGIVEESVRNICRFFAENPDATSYSLGINDSGGHCECADCRASASDAETYYRWCNRVVERVLKEYPDKHFGLLAYRDVIEPPKSVKLNERLVPFICYDRMKWALPHELKKGQKLTRAWHQSSPVIAWYDYIYGTPYLVPRIYFHQMAANYKFAFENGVRAHYAETAANWGEGPKLWLSAKLQWNPNQDVDELLEDWYTACVGEDAAPTLAAYYKLWEDFWTGPALTHGTWYSDATTEYLNYATPEYLDFVELGMVQRSRALLEATISKTKTSEQKARAELLFQAFEYYEASVHTYLSSQKHRQEISDEGEALEFIATTLAGIQMAEKRASLLAGFETHPVLMHPSSIYNPYHSGLRNEAWGTGSLWPVYPWVGESPKVRSKLKEISEASWSVHAYQARFLLEKWRQQRREP